MGVGAPRLARVAGGRLQEGVGVEALGEVDAVEDLVEEVDGEEAIRVPDGWRNLEVRDRGLALEPELEDELVFHDPVVPHLGEPVAVNRFHLHALVEELVGDLQAAAGVADQVEVEDVGVCVVDVRRVDEHVARAQLGAPDGGRVQREAHLIHQFLGDVGGVERCEVALEAERLESGEAGDAVHERRAGGDEPGQRRLKGVDLPLFDQAVAVAVHLVDVHAHAPGDVLAPVDEVLRDAVPAAVLVAAPLLVHEAGLGAQRVAEVHVEGTLHEVLSVVIVPEVAVRVLDLGIDVVARGPARQGGGAAHFGGDHALVPGTGGVADGAGGLRQVLAGFGAGGLRNEVEGAAHLAGPGNGRHRPADHVDAVTRADGRREVAVVVEPLDAAEVVLRGGAAHIQRAGDAEEGRGEGAGHEGDDVVDAGDVELVQELRADRTDGAGRLQDGLAETEHRIHRVRLQDAEVVFHLLLRHEGLEFHDLLVPAFVLRRRLARPKRHRGHPSGTQTPNAAPTRRCCRHQSPPPFWVEKRLEYTAETVLKLRQIQ